nr:hypothetical protein CFP56_32307 [Quercus suber]
MDLSFSSTRGCVACVVMNRVRVVTDRDSGDTSVSLRPGEAVVLAGSDIARRVRSGVVAERSNEGRNDNAQGFGDGEQRQATRAGEDELGESLQSIRLDPGGSGWERSKGRRRQHALRRFRSMRGHAN